MVLRMSHRSGVFTSICSRRSQLHYPAVSDPIISICIPAYQAERYLADTLASVRAQTFTDWELVVIEDGSCDGTEKIVSDFAWSVNQSVFFCRHMPNKGLSATRNACISNAQAPWVALLDADDLWTPGHLAGVVKKAEETAADLVHSGVMLFASDTLRDVEIRAPSSAAIADFPNSLFRGDYAIQPSSVLLRRNLCLELGGFDPQCRYVEDRDFWLRLVRSGARVGYVPELTCRYRQHGEAMSRNIAAMAVGAAEVFERNADWPAVPISLRRRCAAEGWCSAGRMVLRRDPRLARSYFSRALRHRTASPRLLAYWMLSHFLAWVKPAQTP